METLPWDWYVSPDVLRREQERIFRDAWHYAGPLSWVSEPGERFPCRAGDIPVVVVRDRGGTLRAFVNVCRHRGSEIVSERGRPRDAPVPVPRVDVRPRRAPSLRSQVRARAELRRERARPRAGGRRCLGAVRLRPRGSGGAAAPRVARRAAGAARGSGRRDGELVFRERATYTVAANWKVAVENYLECYHCAVAHPGFSRLVDVDPDAYVLEGATRRWSQYGETRDGAGACQFHLVWPALKVNAYPGVANLSIGPVWPVGSERTDGFLDYYFGEGVTDGEAAELIAFDDRVGVEDTALVESVQRGVRSGVIEHGRLLLDSEHLIAGFQHEVRKALQGTTL